MLPVFVLVAACAKKIVTVQVSKEDIMRANEVAREGDVAFNRRDFYAALIRYLEASRLNPNSGFIFNKLGITYSQLKYYTEAENAFLRSIMLTPKYPFAHNNLGTVYFAQDNKKMAEKCFRKAISLKPDTASFHINLGMLYLERRKKDQAMEELRKGLALDPDVLTRSESISLTAAGSAKSSERSYVMARMYASIGNVDRAIRLLEQALNSGFTNFDAIRTEKDFDPIRGDERFVAFLKTAALIAK